MNNQLTAIRSVMSTTVARWRTLIEAVPLELLERAPQPGEWSALECLRHIVMVDRDDFGVRLEHFLDRRPELVPHDPDAPRKPEPERSAQELVEAFASQREKHLAVVARLTATDLDLSSHHPKFGSVKLGHLLNLWAAHDLQHTVQAEEAVMQIFIPETGPWRWEFAEHDVDAPASI